MSVSWYPEESDSSDFFGFTPLGDPLRAGNSMYSDGFDLLRCELAAMALLCDIPFAYLVPAESMLEKEQIRFFHLDPNWIRALLDGAFSIGRNVGVDMESDMAFLESVYQNAMAESLNVRSALQKKPPLPMRNALLLSKNKDCTGFLLRSELVSGWRGLEFAAYKDRDGTQALRALRLETISDEVLIGLYQGIIGRLDILQPPEGFHFGFNKTDGGLKKRLRDPGTGELDYSRNMITVSERGNRVLNIRKTAEEMKSRLGMGKEDTVTSAHIALHMIQNPHMITIRIGDNDK